MEAEFNDYEKNEKWKKIFRNMNSMTKLLPIKESKKVENKALNRYVDVVPYDKTRVKLMRYNLNYINASHVWVPAAERRYILTQGPLPNTSSHFWLMVWEQNSRAILMLNNLIECGNVKCHKYWPEHEIVFHDVSLKVQLRSTKNFKSYILRTFILYDITSNCFREVLHFHYTSWPDFDLPKSCDSFLNFLTAVRDSNCFDLELFGPTVIHCSAGIGRSGTFVLVDSCLIMIEKHKCRDSVNIIDVLLELRNYRMGLIQTSDQLRFSFLAIIEGSKHLIKESHVQNCSKIQRSFGVEEEKQDVQDNADDKVNDEDDSESEIIIVDDDDDDDDDVNVHPSSSILEKNREQIDIVNSSKVDDSQTKLTNNTKQLPSDINKIDETAAMERMKMREERRKKTLEAIMRIKRKQKEMEERLKLKQKLFKYLKLSIGFGCAAICIGLIIYYKKRNPNSVLINYD